MTPSYIQFHTNVQESHSATIIMHTIMSFLSGQDLKNIMKHLEELVVYENYEKEEKDGQSLV